MTSFGPHDRRPCCNSTHEGDSCPRERFPYFPIVDSDPVPWEVAEEAYDVYRRQYPGSARDQSLERLAERGGFHRGELGWLLAGADMKAPQAAYQACPTRRRLEGVMLCPYCRHKMRAELPDDEAKP